MSAGDPTAELVARLRSVWPEPMPLTAGRYRAGGPGTSYLVLPSLRRPVLLVPARDGAAATAIRRPDEGVRLRMWLGALAWAQQRRLLRLLPLARVSIDDPEASDVVAVVRAAVPEGRTLIVRLGRARPGRAVVLQVLAEDGRSVAFAKCGFGERAGHVRGEFAHLADMGGHPANGVRAPRVLAFEDADAGAVLVLEALVPERRAEGDGVPVSAMRALAERAGVRKVLLRETPAVSRLREDVSSMPATAARRWIAAELERLLEDLGDVPVDVGCWHGDWVPWNMTRDGSEVLLWDWEHSERGVPLGFDHVHYLAQHLRSSRGTMRAVEDRWLAIASSDLARHWGVVGPAAAATIRCYLLTINVRYVEDRADSAGSTERVGWSRSLVERVPDHGAGVVVP